MTDTDNRIAALQSAITMTIVALNRGLPGLAKEVTDGFAAFSREAAKHGQHGQARCLTYLADEVRLACDVAIND